MITPAIQVTRATNKNMFDFDCLKKLKNIFQITFTYKLF